MTSENILSVDQLLLIEQICDQYELDRQQNRRQNIESYLENVDTRLHARLRHELGLISANFNTATLHGAELTQRAEQPGAQHLDLSLKTRGDRFELHDRLGAGGAATVWRAFDRQLRRWVALKAPHQNCEIDIERFRRECQVLATMRHPRIVRVLEVYQDSHGWFMISEFINGPSLAQHLKAGPLGYEEIARLLAEVCDGLAYAHANGVVHRDLKPQNILLDEVGNPYISDFGLAKHLKQSDNLSHQGLLIGTPAYMAPEQVSRQSGELDARTDLYAMGVILYQMLTGELPFRGSIESLLQQILNDEAPAPRTLRASVPVDLETLCLKCMEKSLGQRIRSAEFLATELRRFASHQPIESRPIGRLGQIVRLARRHPLPTALAGLSLMLLLIIAGGASAAAYVVNESRVRERSLRLDAEMAKARAEQSAVGESESRRIAEQAQHRAEQLAQRASDEAAISRQALEFLESVFQAADPVSWTLGSQLSLARDPPKLPELLELAAQRIQRELTSQPRIQARLMDTIANSYRGLGRFQEAKQLLEEAVQIRNRLAISDASYQCEVARNMLYRGQVCHDLTEFNQAVKLFDQAMEVARLAAPGSPLCADIDFHRAWSELARRGNTEARQGFARALEIRRQHFSNDSAAVKSAQLGLELSQAGNVNQFALSQLGRLTENYSETNAVVSDYLQMLMYRQAGEYNSAVYSYSKVVGHLDRLLPENHPLYLLALGEYAELLLKQGNFREALDIVNQAIEIGERIAPYHEKLILARQNLGIELMRARRFQEAEMHFRKITEADAHNGTFNWYAHEGLTWLSLMKGDLGEALEHANSLIRDDDTTGGLKSSWGHFALARVQEKQGNTEASIASEQKALEIIESRPELPVKGYWLERIAGMYQRAGKLEKCLSVLEKSLEEDRKTYPAQHPYIADRLAMIAGILTKQGNYAEALQLAKEALEIRLATLPEFDLRIGDSKKMITELESHTNVQQSNVQQSNVQQSTAKHVDTSNSGLGQ